jgi:HSP20 family molecular chaperone IbpA
MIQGINSDFIPQVMRTDIKEREGQYLFEIELPGYKKENIQAQLQNGYLTILAVRSEGLEKDEIKTNYLMKERLVGEVKRTFYVGENIQQEDISAALKDGILSVIVAKHEPMVEGKERKLITIH